MTPSTHDPFKAPLILGGDNLAWSYNLAQAVVVLCACLRALEPHLLHVLRQALDIAGDSSMKEGRDTTPGCA